MKRRSFFYLLTTIAAGLFLAGTIGWVWLFSQSPLGLLKGGSQTPTAVIFVPKQAPAMASLLVNLDRLESLRLVAAKPEARRQARSELAQLRQSILGNSGLNYQQDIQPWLGDEITLAVTTLDTDRDSTNGQQPGYLLAATTKDGERAREFLQLFWQKRAVAGTDLTFEQYKGTQILYGTPKEASALQNPESKIQNSFATAVVGNRFVLFANSPKVLRDAINNVQAAELGLGSSQAYRSTIAHLKQGRIGVAFLNLPQLSALAGKKIDLDEAEPATDESLAIALGLDHQGVLAETALLANQNSSQSASSQPVGALKYIPAFSPLSASGTDLDRLWSGVSERVAEYPDLAGFVNQPLDALQKRWTLQLPEDIFSWVKGEYALGLVPRSAEKTGLDWVFVADTANQKAKAAIAHLDEVAQQQGVSIGSLQLADQPIGVWTQLSTTNKANTQAVSVQAEVVGVRAAVGDYEIFATSVEAMNAALKAPQNSLTNSQTFGEAIAPFSRPNNGYLYLDWAKSQPLLENQFPLLKVIELAGQPFLDHLRSLTISSYGNESGIQRGGVFVKLEG